MKYFAVTLTSVAFAGNLAYDCGTTAFPISANADDDAPSETKCCEDYDYTCKASDCEDDDFQIRDAYDDVDGCCFTPTCDYADKDGSFDCGNGKQRRSTDGATVDAAGCCEDEDVFEPTCGRKKDYTDDRYWNPSVTCDTDTAITYSTINLEDPTKDLCCEDYVHEPICGWESGPIFARVPYSCPSGKVLDWDESDTEDPDTATCCMDFVATCGSVNEAGDRYKCPADEVEISSSFSSTEDPSDKNCCEDATCSAFKQRTCSDYPSSTCDKGSNAAKAKVAFQSAGTYEEECCELVFDAASPVAVAALALLAPLFL